MLYQKLIEQHLKDPRIIISNGIHSFSFLQLHHKVMEYYAFLLEKQIKQGDRVLVIDQDPMETVLLLLACIAGGYVFVPVSSQLDLASRESIIQDCAPSLIIDGKIDWATNMKISEYCLERPLLGKDTLIYLIYTSGSDGVPKGVAARQKQVLFCCNAINQRLCHGRDDRILCSLPISFDYGMYQVFLAFLCGAVLYLDRGSVIQKIPYLIKKWEITEFPTIPTVANFLVKLGMIRQDDVCTLRRITFTGEVLSVSLVEQIKKLLPEVRIVPMYGLTECKRVSVMPLGWENKVMDGSCGLPLDGVAVSLENMDPQTGIGELIVEGDNVMEGYWGHFNQSSQVFSFNPKTGKRIVRTGDLFSIDQDGFLYFRGRKNGTIKIRGYRVNSTWLENRLSANTDVLEVAVIGIPDKFTGEKAAIFIFSVSETAEWTVRENLKMLPNYLWNSKLYFFQKPLPKNRNGKIDRSKLRKFTEEIKKNI